MNDVERGRRMKELREAADLTQPQVAAAFDISKQAVGEWESGKSAPDRRKLIRLDVLYRAGGEVLRIYNVAPETEYVTRSEFNQLDERYHQRLDPTRTPLETQVDAIVALVEELALQLQGVMAVTHQDASSERSTIAQLVAAARPHATPRAESSTRRAARPPG